MNRRATIGRADVARACSGATDSELEAVALFCGFQRAAPHEEPREPQIAMSEPVNAEAEEQPSERKTEIDQPPSRIVYLRSSRYTSLAPVPEREAAPFTPEQLAVDYDRKAPDPAPLMPYARLLPYLRRAFA